MKNILILVFSVISMLYYTQSAKAGTLLEPYAGMVLNSKYVIDTGGDGDLSGTVVGGRLGFQQLGFMAGIDGRRKSLEMKPKTGSDSEYTFTQLGFFVGYDFPILLRVWGEYVFSLEGTDNADSDNKYTGGSGTVFGVGYKIFPFISLNFEYSATATSTIETATTETTVDVNYQTYLLSVSLPLSL
jgi:hypothetical protein